MDFSSDFLVESKSAREQGIGRLKVQHSEELVLNKVKQLLFAIWKDTARTTRQDLANFYEVSVESIDSNYQRHKDEFESDGVEVIRGEDLKEGKRIMRLPSSTSQETIYTAAGALRMGFILRDSEVAKSVRTIAIRFIQGVGQQVSGQVVLQSLIESNPILSPLTEGKSMKLSAPLSRYWDKMKSTLTKKYPQGGITYKSTDGIDVGMATDEIRKEIQFLSTYTDFFKLQGIKELPYKLASETRGKYPSLTSDILTFDTANGSGTAVIMFQFDDLVIDADYVESCVGRGYIQVAKEALGVDQAYLFFVSPFGATSFAEDYIRTRMTVEYKGYVGVLTVQELATFLHTQALSSRKLGAAKGEVNKEFKELLNYSFPDLPVLTEQTSLFDLPSES